MEREETDRKKKKQAEKKGEERETKMLRCQSHSLILEDIIKLSLKPTLVMFEKQKPFETFMPLKTYCLRPLSGLLLQVLLIAVLHRSDLSSVFTRNQLTLKFV